MTRFQIILRSILLLVPAIALAGDYGGGARDCARSPASARSGSMVMLRAKSSEWTEERDYRRQLGNFNSMLLRLASIRSALPVRVSCRSDRMSSSLPDPCRWCIFNCKWLRERKQ